ncbi:MAG: hypothetical protein ABSG43_16520 [Solirubrobacteraceae bacterium]
MTEQTIEAPPIQAPDSVGSPRPAPQRPALDLAELVNRYRWILSAAALLVVSAVVVLWARSRPGYDPYGWLVWGKLTIHLKLDTNGAPSWKPLPFLFTVPYALAGHYALWLWMTTSVAISLSGPLFAWRIAFRLTGADPRRRYAAYAAGLFAAVCVVLMQDPIAPANYMHYVLSAESDTMIVSLCLAAIDCHLSGRHRWAFWLWWLGALGRPEVWPFCGLAGIWLWRSVPSYRRWLVGALGLLLVLWFGIPGLTSKSFFTAGNIAQNSPREVHGNKITGTINRFRELQATGVWIAAALALALAAYRRQRTLLVLAGGALMWVVIEVAFALHGFPAVPRYMFEPGAVVAAIAGVFVGRVILDVPPIATRLVRGLAPARLKATTATQLGAWGAVLVVALVCGSLLGGAHRQEQLERRDLTHERTRTVLIDHLAGVVRRLGAARILACGQPRIPIEYQSVLAWYMNLKIGELYVSQAYLQLHPHPLVNIYPTADHGWKVFPSYVTPAAAARCHGLVVTS